MKICIVGAGAIGGMIGIQLALAGEQVTFICRGANLKAARQDGIRLILEDGTERHACPVTATDHIAEAGVQNVVILALKAHQVAGVASEVRALFGRDTIVVTMQNGIPWWYFLGFPGPH
ncbi:MAG: 2-dehydropantoate 2-reductase N-terminal domain-containing protein, partial [Isosphaeraceae bacterium]